VRILVLMKFRGRLPRNLARFSLPWSQTRHSGHARGPFSEKIAPRNLLGKTGLDYILPGRTSDPLSPPSLSRVGRGRHKCAASRFPTRIIPQACRGRKKKSVKKPCKESDFPVR
jgi:hypothetical protein